MLLVFLLLLILFLVWYTRKLTLAGTLVAGVLAVLIYAGTGMVGVALLGSFFVLGTGVTLWRKDAKIKMDVAEVEGSRRNAGQVLANGGVAGGMGLLAWVVPQYAGCFLAMMAGAFAAAAADTFSSELGVLYGRRFFNILTLRPDRKGLDGVVSWEGTLLGMLGALLIGLVLWAFSGKQLLLWIVIAGTVGNLLDSLLGATLERKGLLGNDGVNLANTLAGALAMLLAVGR